MDPTIEPISSPEASETAAKARVLKYVAIPTVIVLFLALYPQINIWMAKGTGWNGAYAVSNYDEVAYSAYVHSLIEGRPRKNDPFLARDDVEVESLYSIQFIPAYAIAIPARVFGISASLSFVLLNFLIAILSSFAIFFLIRDITKENLLAAVGVVVVLCLGAAMAFEGEVQRKIFGESLVDFFPFLRRYQPGLAFPVFFVFCLLVWRTMTHTGRSIVYPIASGAVLAILVFSYFYLWTAAFAWLGCFALLWFLFRKDERSTTVLRTFIVGVFGIAAIVPYVLMLSNRPQNMDDLTLVTLTRMPNLFEISEVVGLLIAGVIVVFIRNAKLAATSPIVIFTLSLALTPLVLFNQQVITGRSMQPVHYEVFIANYLILLALVLLSWLVAGVAFGENASVKIKRGLLYIGLIAVIWGIVESTATAKRNAGFEGLRDDAMPVLKYLREQEKSDPPINGRYRTVLATNLMVADFLPTVTSYRSLWNPHTSTGGGLNHLENKELFHRYLYYSGFNEDDLAKALNEDVFEVKAALFGGGRALGKLEQNAKPITRAEATDAIGSYAKYRTQFDAAKAADPEVSYIIVPTLAEPDYQQLDRWYQRDEGKEFGYFKIYRLKLKP